MKTHDLKLATESFDVINLGKKTIESRLYDDKRKEIEVGDIIIFTNRENPAQMTKVEVVDLLRYKTFDELFSGNDPTKFGGPDKQWLLNQIHEFYSEADESKDGVVGIEFKLVGVATNRFQPDE